MTESVIPLWVEGKWNPNANPLCDKCLMGKPHLFLWNAELGQWIPCHDRKAFSAENHR